jgi:ABC-type dipeptide/oligopeptide/nickel transport system permease component
MATLNKLQKKIMRRVYYAYALRLATLPGIPQGFMMLAALIALTYFVSIGNVINNMVNVGFNGIGQFAYNAITNTEAWTLLILGVMIFSALSFRFKLKVSETGEPVFVKA